MLVVGKKDLKKLNKIAKHVNVVSLNSLDGDFDNIEVNDKTNVFALIEPGAAAQEIAREIMELKDSDMKKTKRKEKQAKLEEKFVKKYKKQLKESLEVEILLYTAAQKFLSGGIVVIGTVDVTDLQKAYLPVFGKFVAKRLGLTFEDFEGVADSVKNYDGKKKKKKKFVIELIQDIASPVKDFTKKAFKSNSIMLTMPDLFKNGDAKVDKTGKVTIAKEDNIQVKRKSLAKALELAYENDKTAKKFFKEFIEEGRATKKNGKKVKKFADFLSRADKISLMTCLVDVYLHLSAGEEAE